MWTLLVILGILLLIVLASSGVVILLLKLGVIFNEASKPPHLDHGTYTLDQGREVRSESDTQERQRS